MFNKTKDIYDYFYVNKYFMEDMKKYLLWFHDEGYKDYKYLHLDANLLIFLYDIRHYEKYAPVIYKDLVIKVIKHLKLKETYGKSDMEKEIMNIYHSFIFNMRDNLSDFNINNEKLEKLLNIKNELTNKGGHDALYTNRLYYYI